MAHQRISGFWRQLGLDDGVQRVARGYEFGHGVTEPFMFPVQVGKQPGAGRVSP
jgi:hypothetical protein